MMGNQKYIHIICMDCICIVKEELKVIKGEGENKHLEKDKKKCFICNCDPRYREGNGTPLQYSCLENPMDGGAW